MKVYVVMAVSSWDDDIAIVHSLHSSHDMAQGEVAALSDKDVPAYIIERDMNE